MALDQFPGPGQDGGQPLPGDPARDWDGHDDRYLAWLAAEADAGRVEIPPEEPEPGPGLLVCVGEDAGLAGLSAAGFGRGPGGGRDAGGPGAGRADRPGGG